jgi:hypothetical protein
MHVMLQSSYSFLDHVATAAATAAAAAAGWMNDPHGMFELNSTTHVLLDIKVQSYLLPLPLPLPQDAIHWMNAHNARYAARVLLGIQFKHHCCCCRRMDE